MILETNNMNSFKKGDKSQAICFKCKKIVSTTMRIRGVSTDDKEGSKVRVLVGVCDECGSTVSIPIQSIVKIQKKGNK